MARGSQPDRGSWAAFPIDAQSSSSPTTVAPAAVDGTTKPAQGPLEWGAMSDVPAVKCNYVLNHG